MKYRDYVPSFIGLAVVQEKIQNTIKDGNERLKKVETILTAVENAGEKAKVSLTCKDYRTLILNFL